jgi:hypothetical protein
MMVTKRIAYLPPRTFAIMRGRTAIGFVSADDVMDAYAKGTAIFGAHDGATEAILVQDTEVR